MGFNSVFGGLTVYIGVYYMYFSMVTSINKCIYVEKNHKKGAVLYG